MPDFRAIFEAIPEPCLVLDADQAFTIHAANDAYLRTTLTRRAEIVGRSIFEVFPENPADAESTDARAFRASLETVVATRQRHEMPPIRYDIPTSKPDTPFEERFWRVCNIPITDATGAVWRILNRVEDVTALVRLERAANEQRAANEALREKADAAGREASSRTHELAEINRQLQESRALLRDARSRLEVAVDAGAVATWIWEVPSDRLHGDRNMARWFNISPDRLHGTLEDYLAGVHADDIPALRARITESVDTGTNSDAEYRVRGSDGTWRYVIARWRTQRGAAGKADQLIGVVLDVSEIHEATESVRHLREQHRLATDAAELGIFTLTVPPGELSLNERGFEHLGLPPSSRLSLESFYASIHPDDRRLVQTSLERSLESLAPLDIEFRTVGPKGSLRWLHTKGRAVRDPATHVTRFDGISVNLTQVRVVESELRRSEALYRAVVDCLPDYAIFLLNDDGIVSHWNDGAERLLGFTAAEIVGQPGHILFTPEDRARGEPEKEIESAKRTGRASDDRWHLRADGTRFFATGIMTAVTDAGGQRIALAKLMRDITDRHTAAAERELLLQRERAARTEAERTSRLKDEFLATLSHELRTPLNAILGWTQVLMENPADAVEVAEGLEIIDRNTRVQAQLIEELLDMSRIISGKVRLDVKRVDLVAVVNAALDSVRTAAVAKQIRLNVTLPSDVTPVMGDRTRLQQVAWNLLSNAIKFTPSGGQVDVSLQPCAMNMCLRVSDNGAGISPEFLPHVFERFRQADASTTRQHGGLGLGLSIVKQLVELHGGTVRVESPGLGRGATFTAEIPRVPPSHPAEAENESTPKTARERVKAAPDLSGIRILVVEDDADAAHLLERVLKGASAEVLAVRSVSAALDAFERLQPHVVLSDIGMPHEDGYTFIRRLRERPCGADLPVAALTALARREDIQRVLDAGFRTHLAKPIEPAEVLAVVARLSGR